MESTDDVDIMNGPPAREEGLLTSLNGSAYYDHHHSSSLANGLDEPVADTPSANRGRSCNSPIDVDASMEEVTSNLPAEVWHTLSLDTQSSAASETEATDEIADNQKLHERRTGVRQWRSGIVYDVRMRYHSELAMAVKNQDFHPEDPRRIFHIYRELCKSGLVEDPSVSTEPLVDHPLKKVNISAATKEEICLVHDLKHYDFMESIQGKYPRKFLDVLTLFKAMSDEDIMFLEQRYDSIYLNQSTFGAARLSAGGAIALCRAVMRRDVKNGMAIIRPPGHHAECNRPMGFCIFDNVSIAARVCQSDFKDACRKVLIFDW